MLLFSEALPVFSGWLETVTTVVSPPAPVVTEVPDESVLDGEDESPLLVVDEDTEETSDSRPVV